MSFMIYTALLRLEWCK